LRYLAGDAEPFDVVFVDPPFTLGLAAQSCQWLEDKGWLNPQAKIYVETQRSLKLEGMPENWQLLKSKTAGEVAYRLFGRMES
jgi:16S rRNA (guanine966-N2)-methyltransferase